jgi:hypothetical protein
MPENISGVPVGRSVFHLTSPFIGLLNTNRTISLHRPDFGNWHADSQKTQNECAQGGSPHEGNFGVVVLGDGRAGGE